MVKRDDADRGGGVCLGLLVGVALSLIVWAAVLAAVVVWWQFGHIPR